MRKAAVAALALFALWASACAPKPVIAPAVTAPKYPEFIRPPVPPQLSADPAAPGLDRGWRFLQVGDFRNAERELTAALHLSPGFYPAESALGFLDLARKDPKTALDHFDRALAGDPASAAALDGRGEALLALNRDAEAVAAFDAAVAADPALTDVRRRADVLRLRVAERNISSARELARAGRLDEAARAYRSAIAGSPDSAFLYRELGGVERQQNDLSAALDTFRKATLLDPSDAGSFAQIGDLLDASGDASGAIAAYNSSLALEPSPAVQARRDAISSRAEFAKLPEQYRAIETATQVTRADLAALIGIRLAPVLQAMRAQDPGVVTDVRNNWAEPWIMAVTSAGVMEPFANHTFQPRVVVRRTDLAQVVARLLDAVAAPQALASWRAARTKFSDLADTHLAYPASSLAVASGIMQTADGSSFQPSRAVTGVEAVQAIARLQALGAPRGQAPTSR